MEGIQAQPPTMCTHYTDPFGFSEAKDSDMIEEGRIEGDF